MVIGANDEITPGVIKGFMEVWSKRTGSWSKLGSTIEGEYDTDSFGHEVSISADGNTIAGSSKWNPGGWVPGSNTGDKIGHVRVYNLIAGDWVQKENDIDGESFSTVTQRFGEGVFLSPDGKRVVVLHDESGGVHTYIDSSQ